MSDISIVTAFYDIGRGDWSTDVVKNGGPLPHYLQRSVDKYIDHFTRLCSLENEIIVYTSEDLAPRLQAISPKLKVVVFDFFKVYEFMLDQIGKIQSDPAFVKRINPYQVRNPEYWSKEYVGVTSKKAFFVADAYERGLVTNEWAAWVDFGYCRDEEHIPVTKKWSYDFTPGKMHFFNYRDPDIQNALQQVYMAVLHNIVYMIGGVFVGQRDSWRKLDSHMLTALGVLMEDRLVDDDQGLLLYSYFIEPNAYELHKMDPNAPLEEVRSILRKFNKYE